MDMNDLEKILQETVKTARNRLIVTDGGFSMDGDIAPLREITDLAQKYDAQVALISPNLMIYFRCLLMIAMEQVSLVQLGEEPLNTVVSTIKLTSSIRPLEKLSVVPQVDTLPDPKRW